MSGCSIDKNSKELLKNRKETLALLGLDDETKLKGFLSMFLNADKYQMYLTKESNGESVSSSSIEPIVSNVDNSGIKENNVASIATDIMTGEVEDGKQVETNENKTITENAIGTNQDGEQTNEDEVVVDFKKLVEENRTKFKDYNTEEGIIYLETLSIEDIDKLIEQETEVYGSYISLLKEKHSYEKLSKTYNGTYQYIKDVVSGSLEKISRIIDSARKGFEKYSDAVYDNSKDKDKANDKIATKYSELSEKTIRPLKEVKKNIEEIKDSMKIISENKRTFDLIKVKRNAKSSLEKLDVSTSKLVYESLDRAIDNMFTVSVEISKLKEKARSEKVNFDDYDSSGKSYRELKRELEKEKSKIQTYTDSILFYETYKRPNDSFDDFMKARSKTGYVSTILASGSSGFVYNKFAKYFSIPEDQREFYSVKNLPAYLDVGNDTKVIFNKQTDILTPDQIDEISLARELDKPKLIQKYVDKMKPIVIAKTVLAVMKSKGVSFQKRHFGDDFAKENIVNYEKYLKQGSGKDFDNAVQKLNDIPYAKTILAMNNINFDFPDTFKNMVNYEYHNKEDNKGITDIKVTKVKLDSNGIPFVSESVLDNTKSSIDTNKELTDNSYISLLTLIPGSFDSKGDSGHIKKANLNSMTTISDDVKNAIRVHSVAVLEDLIKISNLSSNDEEFEDVWGIEKGNFDGDMKDIESLGRQGYIPRSVIVQKLGSAIYNDIGFKFNANVSSVVSEGIKTELGLLAVEVMNRSGLLDNSKENIKLYNVGSSSSEKNQALIRINNQSKYSKDENGNSEIKSDKLYAEDLKEMSTLMNHLYSFDDKKKPMLEKPKERFDRTVRNGFQKVSQDTNRILNDYESVEHKFNPIAKDVYDLWRKDHNLAYKFVGIGHLYELKEGKGNYNGNLHNIEDAIAQASKFNNEKLELDTLMEFYEDQMFDKETGEHKSESPVFHMSWDFTVSGRYMMDSNINMQTGKTATRYLIQSKQMDSEMQTNENGEFDKDQMYQFKVALAQGFGTGIDKSTDDTAFRNMESKFTIDDKGNVEFKENKDKSLSVEHKGYLFFRAAINKDFTGETKLEKEFVTKINQAKAFDKSKLGPDEDAKKTERALTNGFRSFIGMPVHAGEETHTLTAMRALAELDMFAKSNSGSKVFNHTLTSEADDITSGMILTLMGLGTTDARAFLEKGGVYTSEAQEFWDGFVKTLIIRDENGKIKTGNEKLDNILTSYKGYLTHGFLVEFGKLMDSEDFNKDIKERLKDNESYPVNVINKRIHFKDFYNTVAKESGVKLDSISKNIDKSFVKEEDKKEYLANNIFDLNKIKQIILDLEIVKSDVSKADIKKAISEEVSRVISSNLDSKKYDKLNNNVYAAKSIASSVLSDTVIPKYDVSKEYTIADIKSTIEAGFDALQKHIPSASVELTTANNSFLDINKKDKTSKDIDYDIHVYRSFLKSKGYGRDISGEGNTTENIVSVMNSVMNTSIKDRVTYDAFYSSFRKEYINSMSKYIFDKSMRNIASSEDNDFKDTAGVIVGITKIINDYNKSEFNPENKGNKKQIVDTNSFETVSNFRDKVNQKALIKIAGNKVSRNAAKSPVMVFIYGSSINTIRKSIANIVGKESIYNALIKKANKGDNVRNDIFGATEFDLDNYDYALRILLNEMTNGQIFNDNYLKTKSFKKINNEKSIVENKTKEEIEQDLSVSDLSNLVIDEDMMVPIYRASYGTYGESFADTFTKLFDTITKSREIIKFNEIVRYTIFKSKLNDAFKALALEKELINDESEYTDSIQFNLTKNDVKDIKNKLEKNGFGHSNLDANGSRQSLDKMTAGLVGKRVTISFRDAFDSQASDSSSFSGSFKTDTENTGAAPVTGIHQLDGRKIGLSLEGTGVLNIYDAFYSSSNDLDKTSDKMNEEFLNTVEDYNLVRTSLKEVENMILALEPSERNDILNSIIDSELEYKIVEEGIKKINPEYDIFREGPTGYTFDPSGTSYILNDVFQDINSNLSNPVDVLVRHNQLSDSAKGHKGTAFNHDFEDVDFGLVFSFMSDIVDASRRSKTDRLIDSVKSENESLPKSKRFESDSFVDDYLRTDIADKEDKAKFIITRNEEAYNKNLGIIDKLVKGLNVNDESKTRFKNILEEFKKCIG